MFPKATPATPVVSASGEGREAPASANFFVNLGGFRGQVTVRSYATEADLQALVASVAKAAELFVAAGATADNSGPAAVAEHRQASSGGQTAYSTDGSFEVKHFEPSEYQGRLGWKVAPVDGTTFPKHPMVIYKEGFETVGIQEEELERRFYTQEDFGDNRFRAHYTKPEGKGYKVVRLEVI